MMRSLCNAWIKRWQWKFLVLKSRSLNRRPTFSAKKDIKIMSNVIYYGRSNNIGLVNWERICLRIVRVDRSTYLATVHLLRLDSASEIWPSRAAKHAVDCENGSRHRFATKELAWPRDFRRWPTISTSFDTRERTPLDVVESGSDRSRRKSQEN